MTRRPSRCKNKQSPNPFAGKWKIILIGLLWNAACLVGLGQAHAPSNSLTIVNDSGQFALVKIVGPTRAVAKIPLDQKRTVHIAPGEYYILVRYGFSPKEFIYTKGEPFTVTETEDQFSLTTITLHRVVPGIENPHEVSGEEFESFTISKGNKDSTSNNP